MIINVENKLIYNLYEFLFSAEHKGRHFEECW